MKVCILNTKMIFSGSAKCNILSNAGNLLIEIVLHVLKVVNRYCCEQIASGIVECDMLAVSGCLE